MKKYTLLLLIFISLASFGQQTKVKGMVWDAVNNQPMPFVKVQFQNSKIGTLTDTLGQFYIETYYATHSLVFSSIGYMTYTYKIIKDQEQEIIVRMTNSVTEMDEVKVLPPDEFPSTTLHKRVIANKYINNKEKLLSYEYELYNKIQLDLNNIGDKFTLISGSRTEIFATAEDGQAEAKDPDEIPEREGKGARGPDDQEHAQGRR